MHTSPKHPPTGLHSTGNHKFIFQKYVLEYQFCRGWRAASVVIFFHIRRSVNSKKYPKMRMQTNKTHIFSLLGLRSGFSLFMRADF